MKSVLIIVPLVLDFTGTIASNVKIPPSFLIMVYVPKNVHQDMFKTGIVLETKNVMIKAADYVV